MTIASRSTKEIVNYALVLACRKKLGSILPTLYASLWIREPLWQIMGNLFLKTSLVKEAQSNKNALNAGLIAVMWSIAPPKVATRNATFTALVVVVRHKVGKCWPNRLTKQKLTMMPTAMLFFELFVLETNFWQANSDSKNLWKLETFTCWYFAAIMAIQLSNVCANNGTNWDLIGFTVKDAVDGCIWIACLLLLTKGKLLTEILTFVLSAYRGNLGPKIPQEICLSFCLNSSSMITYIWMC